MSSLLHSPAHGSHCSEPSPGPPQVVQGNMVKIYAWYDNECGYSMRTAELTRIVANRFVRNAK